MANISYKHVNNFSKAFSAEQAPHTQALMAMAGKAYLSGHFLKYLNKIVNKPQYKRMLKIHKRYIKLGLIVPKYT